MGFFEAKLESEHTYRVRPEHVAGIKQALASPYIAADDADCRFRFRRHQRLLQFWCTEAEVTRKQDGVRHRIVFELSRTPIRFKYTKKWFRSGMRYEETVARGKNLSEAAEHLARMPPVDAVLHKAKVQYECVQHAAEFEEPAVSAIVDESRAVHGLGTPTFGDPVYFLEIEGERKSLGTLERSTWFVENLAPRVRALPYASYNRVELCRARREALQPFDAPELKGFLNRVMQRAAEDQIGRMIE